MKTKWVETEAGLYRQFEFSDFKMAFAFMNRVADLAEHAEHHPTWKNTYNRVEIWLQTHDAGDAITQKDYDLASKIDQITL